MNREVSREGNVTTSTCVECGSKKIVDAGPCRAFGEQAAGPSERTVLSRVEPGRLYYCQDCGLGFRYPCPTEEQLADLYAQMSPGRWSYDANTMTAWSLARRFLRKQLSHRSQVSVLDVGAFDGQFLGTLPTNWRRCALEPSAAAATSLQQMGIERLGSFLEAPPSSDREQFDAVCLFDVFEHLPHPRQALAHALEYLRPGGCLVMATGNCRHWTWRWLRGQHWYLDSVQHIRFASPEYFRRAAVQLGVELQRLRLISHHNGTTRQRWEQVTAAIYFGGRESTGLSRLAARAAWWCSGPQPWKARSTAPYLQSLADHLFVVFQRPAAVGTVS